MISGVTQIQEMAPGRICQEATTLEKPGLKVAMMIEEETMAVTTGIGDKPGHCLPKLTGWHW